MTLKTKANTSDEMAAKAAALLAGADPADALEAMLTEQMAAVNAAATRALERAAECSAEHPQIEALYLRQAARLMHLFVRQAEALDRRRAAAEKRGMERTREAERKARVEASDRREEEERERRRRLFMPDPPRRRKRSGANGKGNGAGRAASSGNPQRQTD